MKIAINGFGRIGRVFYRQAFNYPDFEVVAINDLADKDNLLYLLEHDSVYGKFAFPEKIIQKKFLNKKLNLKCSSYLGDSIIKKNIFVCLFCFLFCLSYN